MDAESITLGGLGAESLRMGIQFLYAQAGEILKRRREHEDEEEIPVPTAVNAGEVLDSDPGNLEIQGEALKLVEAEIRILAETLRKYAKEEDEIDPADPSGRKALENAAALRLALETVSGRQLTFRGEQRQEPLPTVNVKVKAERIRGYVEGIKGTKLGKSSIRVEIEATDVGEGGVVRGISDSLE